jgi:hypothetical protein
VRPALPHLLPPVRFDHVNDVANLHAANLAEGQVFGKTRPRCSVARRLIYSSYPGTARSTPEFWCSMRGSWLRITYHGFSGEAERQRGFVRSKPELGGGVGPGLAPLTLVPSASRHQLRRARRRRVPH